MEAVTLGALFLLTLFVPAFAADPRVTAAGADTPLLIVLGIGSAAGVGALLSLTGRAVWNFIWPYSPTGGWRQFSPKLHGGFRGDIAPTLGRYWELAGMPCPTGGDRAIIATSYLLYTEAPAEVRGWIRRRYNRFSDALSAVAAIDLGIFSAVALYPAWNTARWILVIAFFVVALATFAHAFEGRQEAIAMEKYWFALRADSSLHPHPTTHVAFEPGAEITVRPSLRPPHR
jgi:hypothetical protein